MLNGKPGMEGTLKFVRYVTRIWNILNIRSCYSGSRLNDPDREPFKDCRDPRLDFLLQMATMYKQMDCSFKGKRVKGLTGDDGQCSPSNTFWDCRPISGTLLNQGYAYVLPKGNIRATGSRENSVYAGI